MSDAKLVIVHAFASGPEADMARSALEAAGIDAMIQADSVVKFEQQWATQQGTAHIDRAGCIELSKSATYREASDTPTGCLLTSSKLDKRANPFLACAGSRRLP